jgi:glycosyltransferase involved in cell wall biosynthesis
MRQGTPVLARRIGPFPEIVNRSNGGLLFESAGELATAMQQLQDNPELRDRMASQGRDSFLKYWSEGAVIPVFLDVVRRAAQRSGRMDITDKLEKSQ